MWNSVTASLQPLARAMPHLFERHGVGLGIAHALAEGAQGGNWPRRRPVGLMWRLTLKIRDVAVEPLAQPGWPGNRAPGCRRCGKSARAVVEREAARPPRALPR